MVHFKEIYKFPRFQGGGGGGGVQHYPGEVQLSIPVGTYGTCDFTGGGGGGGGGRHL